MKLLFGKVSLACIEPIRLLYTDIFIDQVFGLHFFNDLLILCNRHQMSLLHLMKFLVIDISFVLSWSAQSYCHKILFIDRTKSVCVILSRLFFNLRFMHRYFIYLNNYNIKENVFNQILD